MAGHSSHITHSSFSCQLPPLPSSLHPFLPSSLSLRHQLTDWIDIFKTSLQLSEHAVSPTRSRGSPPLVTSRSTTSLPPCLSLRAPKTKSFKRDIKKGRITEEEEPGVILTRAVVRATSTETTTTLDSLTAERGDPICASAPASNVNYLTAS